MQPIVNQSLTRIGTLTPETGNVRRTRMTIREESMGRVMDILTRMYPNPVLATLRETATNALDATIAAGHDGVVPIEVETPTEASPTLVIRDFGVGMSEEVLTENFGQYGGSTKRDTNAQTGMMGIGAKAPLAFTSEFTVDTRHDGVRTFARIGLDEDGVGYVDILDAMSGPSGLPSGTEVRIPVGDRREEFCAAAATLFSHYVPGTVKVDGALAPSVFSDPDNITVDGLDDIVFIPDGMSEVKVVQGGDVYTINRYHSFPGHWSVALRVPIGTMTPAPSREDVIRDEPTTDAINAVMEYVEVASAIAADKGTEGAETLQAAAKAAETFGRLQFEWRGRRYNRRTSASALDGEMYRAGSFGRNAKVSRIDLTDAPERYPTFVVTGWNTQSISPDMRRKAATLGGEAIHLLFLRGGSVPAEVEERMTGTVTYAEVKKVRLPKQGERKAAGERWVKVYSSEFSAWSTSTVSRKEEDVTGDVVLLETNHASITTALLKGFEALDISLVVLRSNSHARFTREYEGGDVLTLSAAFGLLVSLTPAVVQYPRTAPAWVTAMDGLAEEDLAVFETARSLSADGLSDTEQALVEAVRGAGWNLKHERAVTDYSARCTRVAEESTAAWAEFDARHPLASALLSATGFPRDEDFREGVREYLTRNA